MPLVSRTSRSRRKPPLVADVVVAASFSVRLKPSGRRFVWLILAVSFPIVLLFPSFGAVAPKSTVTPASMLWIVYLGPTGSPLVIGAAPPARAPARKPA